MTEQVIPPAIVAYKHRGRPKPTVCWLRSRPGRLESPQLVSCDYFRLGPPEAQTAIAALVEEGVLIRVKVPGWPQAFLHHQARRPRRIQAQALLAPFDPLIWERTRTERLFGFRYRIEIYVPGGKRQYGYTSCRSFSVTASSRASTLKRTGRLLAFYRPYITNLAHQSRSEVLEAELASLARWLGLTAIQQTKIASVSHQTNPVEVRPGTAAIDPGLPETGQSASGPDYDVKVRRLQEPMFLSTQNFLRPIRLDFVPEGSLCHSTFSRQGQIMGKARNKHVHSGGHIRAVLDRMEPDLRLLEGTVVVLRTLAETSDSIQPIAFEALGYLSGETLQRISSCWREAMSDLRDS